MTLIEVQRDLFQRMGVELLHLQSVENAIRLCLQVVLPEVPISTLEALHALEQREAKKTLGYFLCTLRERVQVEAEFDNLLAEFLKNRNTFVHNLWSLEGWEPRSEDGCARCIQFVQALGDQATHVLNVFTGLLRAWEIQTGHLTELPGAEEQFRKIEQDYVPLVNSLFTARDA